MTLNSGHDVSEQFLFFTLKFSIFPINLQKKKKSKGGVSETPRMMRMKPLFRPLLDHHDRGISLEAQDERHDLVVLVAQDERQAIYAHHVDAEQHPRLSWMLLLLLLLLLLRRRRLLLLLLRPLLMRLLLMLGLMPPASSRSCYSCHC